MSKKATSTSKSSVPRYNFYFMLSELRQQFVSKYEVKITRDEGKEK